MAPRRRTDRVKGVALDMARRTLGTARREWPRWRKARWQRSHPSGQDSARLAFVVGSQRSGTTMLLEVLDRSRETVVYHEYHAQAMDAFHLRPLKVIESLAARSAAKLMVLKPLTETQRVPELLGRFPDSRAIWLFRSYQDVANSAIAMFPGKSWEFVEAVRAGDLASIGLRREEVSSVLQDLVKQLASPDAREQEAASLFWYARNQLYFDMDLEGDPRVLLVAYESLVTQPERYFPIIYRHLDLEFDQRHVANVRFGSLVRDPFGPINSAIQQACDEMLHRLQIVSERQASVMELAVAVPGSPSPSSLDPL